MPTKTKEINEENVEKKASSKKATTKKSATTKTKSKTKSTTKKIDTKKKSATKKATSKKATSKKATSKKVSAKKENVEKNIKPIATVVEYYDLPYRYIETVVKILAQTPKRLFVYWDISDSDRQKYMKAFGERFFEETYPVLLVHNEDMNYTFEVPINDFANSWYLHINDSKCHYRVELGRRPNYYNQEAAKEIEENIKTDYIYVTSSNKIESPNDRVLFSTNENNTVKFRNIKSNEEKSVSLFDIVKHLPAIKKVQNIPYIKEELLMTMYSGIYKNEDISLFERLSNPSSGGIGNPSSGNLSSRFI